MLENFAGAHLLVLTLLLYGGQKLMRWWLTLVARRKSDELFMLNLLLVTLGLAWLTEHAGLSLALGALVAGMLVAQLSKRLEIGRGDFQVFDVERHWMRPLIGRIRAKRLL